MFVIGKTLRPSLIFLDLLDVAVKHLCKCLDKLVYSQASYISELALVFLIGKTLRLSLIFSCLQDVAVKHFWTS
jgi:hypothetical protein